MQWLLSYQGQLLSKHAWQQGMRTPPGNNMGIWIK